MTLQSRLALGLVTIAIILVGPLAFAVLSLYRLQGTSIELRDRDVAGSLALGRLRDELNEVRRRELALLFGKKFEASREALDQQIAKVASLSDSLKAFELTDYSQAIGASIKQITDAAPPEYRASLAGDTAVADSLSLHVFVPALNHADSTSAGAEHDLQARTTQRVDSQAAVIERTKTVSIAALVLALALAGTIAFWLTRSISAPIRDLKSGMRPCPTGSSTTSCACRPAGPTSWDSSP